MAGLQEDLEPAIDPDTAGVACGSKEQPESMLICDSCQQGFHLSCFGLAVIPEEEQWICVGCTALQNLEIGSSILLESPQVLYSDGSDPHLTQGLFKGSIQSLEKLQQDSSGTFCQVQAEMDLGPVAESLKFYSNSTLKQLIRPPKASLKLAQQLYELPGVELTNVVLSSRRHNMFGSPAAAAGLATEAWCLLPDDGGMVSDASAQRVLEQPAKQGYLLQRHKKDLPSATVEPALRTQMQPLQVAAAQMQPMQVAAPQMQPMQVAAAQMQPMQVAAAQMQPLQIAAAQMQAMQVAAAQMQAMQVAAAQMQPMQVATAQMQPMQVAAAQMQPMQVAAAQMQPMQVAAAQMQPMQVAAAQMQPMQVAAAQMQPMQVAAAQMQPTESAAAQMQPTGFTAAQLQPAAQAAHMQTSLASQAAASAVHPMQYNNFAPAMPFFYPPMMPFGWPFGWPAQHGLVPNNVPAAGQRLANNQSTVVTAADQSMSAAVAPRQYQQAKAKRAKKQLSVQEAYEADNDSGAADISDDDWIAQTEMAPANAQLTKVVYKVLSTPRAKGSRMMINPSLAKQKARTVCAVGLKLWRHVISSAAASSANNRIQLTPAQIKQAIAEFSDQHASHKSFLELKENRNLMQHIATLLLLLSVNDDPLTIQSDIVTQRVLSCVQLQGQRKTSLNNVLSHARSGFRLLFGRGLLPGIDSSTSTVKVEQDTLRIDLHSPLPDAAITDFGEAMQARGTLKREPQGCVRTLETTQLHILYAWHEILSQLSALRRWSKPEFIPARILDQINRWCCVLLGWHFRGLLDNGRPSDISLYHIGCFNLVLPNQQSTPLAAVVLTSLQQQQQHSLDETLEAFRSAGAVLQIKIPKCKQDQKKRKSNGNSPVDWLEIYKPLLDPALGLYCPTRTISFCMAVSWYVKGAVSARLLNVRRLGSAKAAAKRHMQPDFQATGSSNFKVLTAGNLNSYIPSLYLLHKKPQQSSSSSVASDNSSASDGNCSEEDNSKTREAIDADSEASSKAGSSSSSAAMGEQYLLAHTKPSKASSLQVVLKLRQLSGYDQRHSLQKDMLQSGIPLELAAKLASHSLEETKRYASNSCYELNDSTAMPIKLSSPEWTSRDLVPQPLAADSSLDGIPVHLNLFRSPTLNLSPAAGVRTVADPKLAALFSNNSFKENHKVMQAFIDSFSSDPKLSSLLHEPVLGGSDTNELLPVKLLRDIPGVIHLRSGPVVSDFLSRLTTFSAAGLADPAADRLVHPGLADAYNQLAKNAAAMSSKLAQKGGNDAVMVQQDAAMPQLVIKHYSQVTFGRLDLAWQQLGSGSIA